tara:strand:- start:32 stop:580 length:549 start_codon:yes stop_codon:yes gene_type:complete
LRCIYKTYKEIIVTKKNKPRLNEDIKASKVRLIDENGQQVGICEINEALNKALMAGLDLMELSPDSDPPVCKIIDYGKYRYEKQREKKLNKKKQHIIHVKEIRVRPNIGQHDLITKLKKGQKFLLNGDKLKITVMFRGREMGRMEDGVKILDEVIEGLSEISKVDKKPSTEGRRISVVLSPI